MKVPNISSMSVEALEALDMAIIAELQSRDMVREEYEPPTWI